MTKRIRTRKTRTRRTRQIRTGRTKQLKIKNNWKKRTHICMHFIWPYRIDGAYSGILHHNAGYRDTPQHEKRLADPLLTRHVAMETSSPEIIV